MFDKWLKLPAHYYLRITALIILIVGVCLHNTLMSIGTIWIGANWLIEAKYKLYWQQFKSTPSIWFLIGFLLLCFLSLLWSNDIAFGLKDISKKLPFFVIPFVLGTSERIEKKVIFFLLYIFLGVLVLTSVINYYRFNYVLIDHVDVREMSYFISHVRYSMLIVIGMAVSVYLIIQKKGPSLLWTILGFWLIYYAFRSQTFTVYFLFFSLVVVSVFYGVNSISNKKLKLFVSLFFTAILAVSAATLNTLINANPIASDVAYEDLDKYTVNGRRYFHDMESTDRENGHLVWLYMQQDELKEQWNNRSTIAYDSLDALGQPMFGTLIRYMTSKNIRKDSVGVWQLGLDEINKIENGCASVVMNTGFKAKVQEFITQWHWYQKGGDPNGHSILQRAEHISVGWQLAKYNWLLGVGVGDLHQAFMNEYIKQNSLLREENRHRAHNQFLSFWIALGVVGLLIFLGFLVSPLLFTTEKTYFFWSIFIILLISLFFQDLLETQAGVCIFGLFYSLVAFRESSRPEAHEKSYRYCQ